VALPIAWLLLRALFRRLSAQWRREPVVVEEPAGVVASS
jgi:hypothetical protein